jgi:hypothetical protein
MMKYAVTTNRASVKNRAVKRAVDIGRSANVDSFAA